MAQLTENQRKKLAVLEARYDGRGGGAIVLDGTFDGLASPSICESLQREEQLQYSFMVIYQILVLALTLVVLALLGLAAWRVAYGAEFQAIIAGAGAVVGGGAAAFLLNQRADARDIHAAAQAGLEKHRCP